MRWSLDEDLGLAAELVCHAYLPSRTVLRSEVVSWTADVLERLAPDDPVRPRVLSLLAGGMSWVGRLEDAVRLGEEARVEAAGSAVALQALEGLADAATYQGRLDDAVSLAREAEELALRHGDDFVDFARLGIALLAYGGDPRAGSPSSPVRRSVRTVHARLVRVRRGRRRSTGIEGALEHLDHAVEIATEVGDRFVTEVALLSSSSLRARTEISQAAVDRFSELLEHFGAGGDPGHLVTSLRNLVTLQVRLGQYRPAAALAPSPTTRRRQRMAKRRSSWSPRGQGAVAPSTTWRSRRSLRSGRPAHSRPRRRRRALGRPGAVAALTTTAAGR